ncbi:DUF2993 domain-containing protein [Streptomyces sp. NPDC048278]|uniref:LmeA family phospholipid-binding protein n=1 Tax=Streptomyces sp. NPDC048278 TaxID=3155809 RepID=UPI003427B8AD
MSASRNGYDDGSQYRYDDGSSYEPYYPPYDAWGDGSVAPGAVPGSTEDHGPRPPRRRRLGFAVGALVALALVPLAADRFVAVRIESRTAKAFQEGMRTPLPPEVHVRGFPVLTQAASGTLRRVDITAHDIPADGSDRPLPVTELSLRLDGLTKSDDDSEARAKSAEATARLSYPDLSDSLGLEVSQGDRPGRVSAVVPLPFGDQVTVTTSVTAATGNSIVFRDFKVTGGALPDVGSRLLDKVLAQPIRLRNIPSGLKLRSLTSTADGLTAGFSGSSVTFRAEGTSQDGASRSGTTSGKA